MNFDWLSSLISSGVIVSLIEFGKGLYNRKNEKKSGELDNTQKELDIATRLAEERDKAEMHGKGELDYYRSLCAEKNDRLRLKEDLIEEKNKEINQLGNQVTFLEAYRCVKSACQNRVPPFGVDYLDIKSGKIIFHHDAEKEEIQILKDEDA